ncbi:inositol 2-dehydrogenase [Pseudomonas fluorescens]|uniref:inositol 2-dehydrogenase n=1 Tax=Pseudomonas fluorescens TaxID=294 RepID=UPI001BE75665|nr:inositol 2-dehydrogenase [Pseudomonas fluorescens]MBT2372188.1 inositol 2-dehydrogenase [Pseudomonas fluorescens]
MLRIAVLGAGRIAKIHAANVAAHPDAHLVLVADPWREGVDALAAQLGCEAAYDCAAVLSRDDIDAVVIGTPTDTHIDLLLVAVTQGKAVLCEKPIDLDIAKARVAVTAVEHQGGRVMLGFNRRFDPDILSLRKAIDAGQIGAVRQVIITSRDPGLAPRDYLSHSGGILRDMTIHDFDMARHLLGEEPCEISAIASRLVDPTLAQIDDYDSVMVLLRTASGKQCHINCCREAVYGYDQRVEVSGATGVLLTDNHRPSTLRHWNREHTEAREPLQHFFLERYADAYRNELGQFINALHTGAALPTHMRDGLYALHLADCALESIRTGRTVAIDYRLLG